MRIDATDAGERCSVLRLDGRLNMASAPSLKRAIATAVNNGRPRVVVDLGYVVFMDSSGLGSLIAGLKSTRQAGGDLRITAGSEQVRTVLRLTNMDRVLRPYETVQAAADGW
jgi:anti-sigma B factor antagonist